MLDPRTRLLLEAPLGRALYATLGATGAVLNAALTDSNVIFAGGLFGLGMALYFASQGAGSPSGRSSRISRGLSLQRARGGSRCTSSAI